MRNIFLFLRRYFTFILFVLLQIISLYLVFRFNKFHHAAFTGVANEVTGRINNEIDKLDDYFHQGDEARRVHRMNDSLLNLIPANFLTPDTGKRAVVDSIRLDTNFSIRRYYFRDAKVVYNTVNAEKNYLQLNRGSNFGIRENMAVLSSEGGVVGIVISVSPNFSQVMSMLHVQSSISAAHAPTGTLGKVEWDAKDPRYVLLKGISKSVSVKTGDTVTTSRYSYNFPPNYLIGRIHEIQTDPATGFYMLKVKTAVNFSTIQQVFVVENLFRDEQMKLAEETEKKIEQQKNKQR